MFRDRRFERPFAGVVDHEREMSGAAGPDEESILPIRLPAVVVHRVQELRDVAPEPDRPDDRRPIGERENRRRAALG
jgi:hypothetical protein